MTARDIRNNTPRQHRLQPLNAWQGQLGMELGVAKPRFARLDSPGNGIRALDKLLINHRSKDGMPDVGGTGIDTVLETINRWAPSKDTETMAGCDCPGRDQHSSSERWTPRHGCH